jgi:HK97 family phage portal protein
MGYEPDDYEQRDVLSVGDPALAEWLGLSGQTDAGVTVNETTALGLASYYRGVAIVSATIASLPLKTYRRLPDDSRERVSSFLDEPHPAYTPYEWAELVVCHLLIHGNAYLQHVYGGAGQLVGLQPLHPSAVTVKPIKSAEDRARYGDGLKYFTVRLADGDQVDLTTEDVTHIPGLGTDGLAGVAPLNVHRNAIATGLAGDSAAARMFANGLLVGALVSAEDDLDPEDAKAAKAGLKAKLGGLRNAGDIAFVNARLKVQQLTSNAVDGQFIEGRTFQVNETARLLGLPKVLLAEDGASTWGSGIGQLMRWMSRTTLMPITTRIEQRLSRLLPAPRYSEFDYTGLLQPTAEEEIPLLISQIEAGLITVDEARRIRNLPPLRPTAVPNPEEEVA